MRVGRSTFWWVTAMLFCACCSGPTRPESLRPIIVERIDGLTGFEAELDSLRVLLQIPGLSAAIAQNGEIVWSRGFGLADVDAERPATPITSFALASLTKTFAATITMQLVEEGLISLDDPVSDYGIFLTSEGTIRIRHLLSHTSEGVPGTQFRYNGGRFAELDKVIEQATGETFARRVCERILQPLGLMHTAPNVAERASFEESGLDRSSFITNITAPYCWRNGRVERGRHLDFFCTAAGLMGSAEDVACYSMAIDAGQFLTADTWAEVFAPALDGDGNLLPYALGWFVHVHEGIRIVWHHGWGPADSALIVRVPERQLTFVALANSDRMTSYHSPGVDSDVLKYGAARLFIESFVTGSRPFPVAPVRRAVSPP